MPSIFMTLPASVTTNALLRENATEVGRSSGRAPHDLLDREPRQEIHPADLGALHPDHGPPPGSPYQAARLHAHPDSAPRRSPGVHFNRRAVVSIQAAPTLGGPSDDGLKADLGHALLRVTTFRM
jgi:hypothetical protein